MSCILESEPPNGVFNSALSLNNNNNPPTTDPVTMSIVTVSETIKIETLNVTSQSTAMTGFEGPEKRLEVTFTLNPSRPRGLREISKDQWQELLDLAKCTIISSTSNSHIDSFVLSESSLFVGSNKVVLKTCGTTTLLNCLNKLEEYGKMCGSEIEFLLFSRKNFNFPEKQLHPHRNFEMEVSLLSKKFPNGQAHVLGPVHSSGDHHFVFFSHPRCPPDFLSSSDDEDDETTKISKSEVTLEILMSQLDPTAMSYYFRETNPTRTAKETTRDFGLSALLPNMQSDEVLFDPCGYSLNAINTQLEEDRFSDDSFGLEIPNYATVHITPEAHCSFVSFETNLRDRDLGANGPSVRAGLIEKVVSLYRPNRFSVVASSLSKGHSHFFKIPRVPGYSCRFKTHYEYELGFQVTMMNFTKSTGSSLELGALRSPSQTHISLKESQ